jgi:serine/threonine-protein kinase
MPADLAHAQKQLVAGDVVAGRFVVERRIGSGGMGEVVSARHVELGTLVAIKAIRRDVLGDPDAMARFKREAKALAKLTSVHTVRIYDVGVTDGGLPYLIMEHLVGRDLASVLGGTGPLPVDEALDFMIQACDALTEAHDAGIVHRDLKPPNLFLSKKKSGENHIRVLDFGLAKPIRETTSLGKLKLTANGEVIGTSHYMAPEQVMGGDLSVRTDIWAVGACLFRLLTAQHPFRGHTPAAVCAAIIGAPPPNIRELRPDLPSNVEAIVMRCLEKDPANRFPDVRHLRTALEQARRASAAAFAPLAPAVSVGSEPPTHRMDQPPATVLAPRAQDAPAARMGVGGKTALLFGFAVALAGAVSLVVLVGVRRTTQVRLAPVGLIAPAMAQAPLAETSASPALSASAGEPLSSVTPADPRTAPTATPPPSRRARPASAGAAAGRGTPPTAPADPAPARAVTASPSSGALYDHL